MTQVKNVIRDNYNAMLLNEFLRKEIKDAGFSKVDITKPQQVQESHCMLRDKGLL